jgi:hypothetical protein
VAAASKRRRWAGVLLVAIAVACGDKGASKGDDQAAPAPAPTGGFETSWSGYVSKTYPGTLSDNAEAVKSALRALDLEITRDRGGIFEQSLDAKARDGTSLVVSVKEVGKDKTRVSVKVGYLLGDGDAARRILSEVEEKITAGRADAEQRRRRWRSPGSGMGMTGTTTTTTLPGAR